MDADSNNSTGTGSMLTTLICSAGLAAWGCVAAISVAVALSVWL